MNALKIPHQGVGWVSNSVYSLDLLGLALSLTAGHGYVTQQTPWLFPEPRPEASLLSDQWYVFVRHPKCRLEDKIFENGPLGEVKALLERKKSKIAVVPLSFLSQDAGRSPPGTCCQIQTIFVSMSPEAACEDLDNAAGTVRSWKTHLALGFF